MDDPQQGQISRALIENQTSTDLRGTAARNVVESIVQGNIPVQPAVSFDCTRQSKKENASPRACDWISLQSISWAAAPLAMRITHSGTPWSIPPLGQNSASKSDQHKYRQGEQIFSLFLLHCNARCCLVLTQETLQDFSARALDPKPAHLKQMRRTAGILNISHSIF